MNALVLLPSFFFELGCIFGFWQLNFNQINGHAVAVPGIFGFPQSAAIDELHSKHPFNPYGNSKKIVEDILADMDMDMAYGFKSVCFRFFNAPCPSERNSNAVGQPFGAKLSASFMVDLVQAQ